MAASISPITEDGRKRVQDLLTRAAGDIEFRELLMENPSEALAGTDLTDAEKTAISGLRHVALEEWGVDVRAFHSFILDNGNGFTMPEHPTI